MYFVSRAQAESLLFVSEGYALSMRPKFRLDWKTDQAELSAVMHNTHVIEAIGICIGLALHEDPLDNFVVKFARHGEVGEPKREERECS